MDKSDLEVILQTWSRMEIPPKPSRKAVKIILKESFLQLILEIVLIPFVISNIPVKMPEMKLVSMFKDWKIGFSKTVKLFNKPLALKMEIILEKITTNPPIKRMVEMLLVILSAKISPKLENETDFCVVWNETDLVSDRKVFFSFFQ